MATPAAPANRVRIVILGGGFGGVYTARMLEKIWRGDGVEITLVSRDNYFLITPLLFEAGSGVLEPRHAVNPIRSMFRSVRFIEGEIEEIDLDRHTVGVTPARDRKVELPYDHLVLALGGITNKSLIPGSKDALTFKTMGDAIYLRNHVIDLLEQADVEQDADRKKSHLRFVIVGAGFVALELMGELTVFVKSALRFYPRIRLEDVQFEMLEAGPQVAPELDPSLASYAASALEKRGVRIRTNTKVNQLERNRVHLPDGTTLTAETIILATGVSPSPLVGRLPLDKDPKGRAKVEPTMRSASHPQVWAMGDCAFIPDPDGKPYPPLAQHALREARQLAKNITAAIRGQQPEPFVYRSQGTLAALGHFDGVGTVFGIKIRGFIAWWVWRGYYLLQMPGWSRRLRIVIDWTVSLFFPYDVVKLDFTHGTNPHTRDPQSQIATDLQPPENG